MKTAFLILSAFVAQGALASAETCVAQKVTEIGYASSIYYQVDCGTEAFSGTTYYQTLLLPLPYNASAAARKDLAALMKSKGYTQAAKITEVIEKFVTDYGFGRTGIYEESAAFDDAVFIFEKSAPVANYCAALEKNSQTIGHANKQKISDYIVSCAPKAVSEILKGVTAEEFANYMEKLGTKLAVSTSYRGSGSRGLLHVYKTSH